MSRLSQGVRKLLGKPKRSQQRSEFLKRIDIIEHRLNQFSEGLTHAHHRLNIFDSNIDSKSQNLTRTKSLDQGTSAEDHRMMTLQQRGSAKPPLNLSGEKAEHADITDDEFWSIVPKVYDYTELPVSILYNLYSAIRYVISAGIQGDIVECGVHMGGSVMAAEHALLKFDAFPDRRIFALDTFTGFVTRHETLDVDLQTGMAACDPTDSFDFGERSIANMQSVGFSRLNIVRGDVLKTIPTLKVESIALLRLDTDTYETTKFELEQLYDRVVPGGVVIIDDYGYTLGCKKAVDDFIRDKPILLQRINRNVRSWVKHSASS
jgi:O-methyltransferase